MSQRDGEPGSTDERPDVTGLVPCVWKSVAERCHLPEGSCWWGSGQEKSHTFLVTVFGSEECVSLPPQPGHWLLALGVLEAETVMGRHRREGSVRTTGHLWWKQDLVTILKRCWKF